MADENVCITLQHKRTFHVRVIKQANVIVHYNYKVTCVLARRMSIDHFVLISVLTILLDGHYSKAPTWADTPLSIIKIETHTQPSCKRKK